MKFVHCCSILLISIVFHNLNPAPYLAPSRRDAGESPWCAILDIRNLPPALEFAIRYAIAPEILDHRG